MDKLTVSATLLILAIGASFGILAQPGPLDDSAAEDLAYHAADDTDAYSSDDIAKLKDLAAKGSPAAEYGLGLAYHTEAWAIAPNALIPCTYMGTPFASPGSLSADLAASEKLCAKAIKHYKAAIKLGDQSATSELAHEYYQTAFVIIALAKYVDEQGGGTPDYSAMRSYDNQLCPRTLAIWRDPKVAHDGKTTFDQGMARVGGVCVTKSLREAEILFKQSCEDGTGSGCVMVAGTEYTNKHQDVADQYVAKALALPITDDLAGSLATYYTSVDVDNDKAAHWSGIAQDQRNKQETAYRVWATIHERMEDAVNQQGNGEQ